ncbi:uncharacterized protein LOC131433804 [Malaya genurostris]|uniref:uncharacterized protein LOC131433804 n=1 Tax=Malaya genurostris TaxID=325434 RepID=UPI0026F3EB66|nr:uncharacterized protein LOC131433804 [Malaya genurostris]
MLQPQANETAAASVAVKLPEFWKNDPAMWFAQAEAQFVLAGVTRDATKFYHIIAKVDQSVLCHISDLVANPPENDKYMSIKARLLSRFEMSAQAKMEKLLNSCDLGDMKPTHLLARMQDLTAGLKVDDGLMKMLFLQRLPGSVKAVLTIHDGTLSKLAEMADKMVDTTSTHVAAVAPPPSSQIGDIDGQIAHLTAEIRKLKEFTRSKHERNRSSSRTRPDTDDETVCWYHRKYGVQVGTSTESRRLSILDRTHSIRFLIDTGSDVSILPATRKDKTKPPIPFILHAANSTNIKTFDKRFLYVDLGLRRRFSWLQT